MASKKSPSPSSRAVLVTMLIAVLGVGVFAAYVNMTPGAARVADDLRKPEISRPGANVDVQGTPVVGKPIAQDLQLRVPTVAGEDVKLDRQIGAVAPGVDPKTFLLTETMASMGIDGGRAVGVQVKNGVAHVDVNQAVLEHGYGSMEEAQLVKALQLALGQFKEVESFTLWCNGEPVESLGHFEFSEPVKVVR